jgi:hypothetical protein
VDHFANPPRAIIPFPHPPNQTSGVPPIAATAASGRLDSDEISGTTRYMDTPSQRVRFAHALEERDRWLALIDRCEPSFAARDRFRLCGTQARLGYSPAEQRYFVSSSSCRNRWCPACRVRRQMSIRESLARYFVNAPAKKWQFITLTLRHTSAPLSQQIDFLQSCFKRLRQEPIWRGRVTHGFAVVEVTRNKKTLQWHPHLHILAHVRFLDWSKLRSAWCKLTHGSNIIDCGTVKTETDAIRYVLAYIGKPPPETVLHDDAAMIELYAAMHNQHLLIRFGRPPVKPPAAEPHTLPADLVWLGSVETLIDEAIGGSERARMHIERWMQQRRADARSLHCEVLLLALKRKPDPPVSLESIVEAEVDLARFRDETRYDLPF